MAWSSADLHDFVTALREHPEWREDVRREVLTEDLLAVPATTSRLEAALERLAQAQARTEATLKEFMAATARQFEDVNRRLDAVDRRLDATAGRLDRLDGHVGNLEGWQYESKFNAPGRVGTILRNSTRIYATELDAVMDALRADLLEEADLDQLQALDFLFRGSDRHSHQETLVALEVSRVVDANDVRRARRRADILARCGLVAIAAAGGRSVEPRARELAEREGVRLLIDRSEEPEAPEA